MVPLLTASSPIEAKVIAARLGAEGIVWELRGSVDGPLAMGPIDVLVDEDDLGEAREVLLIDDLEDSFPDRATNRETTLRDVLVVAAILALILLFALARIGSRV
jgi:hypothetical protein